jgi:type II secretory ATPase GspE/PulE/Tfp pilus assembly ATPase PilB-like protein
MDPLTRDATYKGRSTMAIRDQARLTGGLKSLREDGIRKVLAGHTTIEEILSVAGRVDGTDDLRLGST